MFNNNIKRIVNPPRPVSGNKKLLCMPHAATKALWAAWPLTYNIYSQKTLYDAPKSIFSLIAALLNFYLEQTANLQF